MLTKFRKFFRNIFIPEAYRLRLYERKMERELGGALRKAKEGCNKDDIEEAKYEYNSEMFRIYEQREALFTNQLIEKANRLRVHVPAKPKWTYEDGFEENEDWDGIEEIYLTNKGSAKVQEEIEKRLRWRRERIHFVIQCITATLTMVAAVSGWIAFFLK